MIRDQRLVTLVVLAGVFSVAGFFIPSVRGHESLSFQEDIAPILVGRCLGCHNNEDDQGGLNMETFELLQQGGDIEGDLILLPGEPNESHLIQVVRPDAVIRMPYKQEPLSDREISLLERWVREGAEFDGASPSETRLASLVDPMANLPEVEVVASVVDPVSALAFSTDGQWIAVARGSSLHLIDRSSEQISKTLDDQGGPINSLIFTSDGKSVVAAGGRAGIFGEILVWELATGKVTQRIKGHTDAILSASLHPDDKTLATSSYDQLILLWDLESGTLLRTLKEHTDAVYGVTFNDDGDRLASVSGDRTVKIWDPESGRRLISIGDSTAELYAIAFEPEGSAILAGGVDQTIRRWRLDGSSAVLTNSAIAHDGPILQLLASRDGNAVISSSEDLTLKRWSLPELTPLTAFPQQPDWPIAVVLDPVDNQLAIGRYDGSLVIQDLGTEPGEPRLLLSTGTNSDETPVATPESQEKPVLVKQPTLDPPSPRGALAGQTVTVQLSGNGVGQANTVVFDHHEMIARILPSDDPKPNALTIEVSIGPDVPRGIHQLHVQTPLGVPASRPFAVFSMETVNESESNNQANEASVIETPRILSGTIERPGDRDQFQISAQTGDVFVVDDWGKDLGSSLDPILELRNASGKTVARGRSELTFESELDEVLTLVVSDRQLGGSGGHFYQLEIGNIPKLAHAFPRGVSRGSNTEVNLEGVNLKSSTAVVEATEEMTSGTLLPIPSSVWGAGDRLKPSPLRSVVAEGPQTVEIEPNDSLGDAVVLSVPGGASGIIEQPGDSDLFRFEAKSGQPLVLEVFGERIGSEIDPALEILDANGEPVPLVVLRPVTALAVAFRDHNATQRNIRLTKWDQLQQDDYVLIGRELTRIFRLPRNPDDDALFWSMSGRRLAYFGTTPEQHPKAQTIQKVALYPPGTSFPPGGAKPITVYSLNDDAPGIGQDASLSFTPPGDGNYHVRIRDARGLGDPQNVYHLVVRHPHPDFTVSLSTENPNIPRGGSTVLTVNVSRLDGFEGPIAIDVEDLPPGITATSAMVERGHHSADLLLTASDEAPTFSAPTWRLVAQSSDPDSGQTLRHELDPGGSRAGWITVTPSGDLKVSTDQNRVVVRPGGIARMAFQVERSEAFNGRVPIDVRNLPHGVRVLDIGLNGVLITEDRTDRTITLYAEPWVKPTERPFFGVARVEAAGINYSTPQITLVVQSEEIAEE